MAQPRGGDMIFQSNLENMISKSNATHRVSFDKNLTSLALESTEHHSKALIAVVVSHLAKVNHSHSHYNSQSQSSSDID